MSRPLLGLIYVGTRLSQPMTRPLVDTNAHINLSNFFLKYTKRTLDYSLNFKNSQSERNFTGYCDSNSANTKTE